MKNTPRYKPVRYYMATYGFGPTYWRSIFKRLGHTKSSDGVRAEMLMDENLYLVFLDSNKVAGTDEIQQIAATI